METQFMGETEAKMTTTHMIERDPATFHEIWHDAWREAWKAEHEQLAAAAYAVVDLVDDIVPDLKATRALREALKGVE